MIHRFWRGFTFIHRGFLLLRQRPDLAVLLIIPFFIQFVLFILGITTLSGYVQTFATQSTAFFMATFDAPFFSFLYYPMLILFWLVFVVVLVVALYFIGSVTSSPFYALAAEMILREKKIVPAVQPGVWRMILFSIRMFKISLLRGLMLGGLSAVLFIFSFVPGFNLVIGYFIFTLVAFDAADYAHEALGKTLSERVQHFRTHLTEYLGMGGALGLTVLVPGLILLIMPLAVIGAADLVGSDDTRANS